MRSTQLMSEARQRQGRLAVQPEVDGLRDRRAGPAERALATVLRRSPQPSGH